MTPTEILHQVRRTGPTAVAVLLLMAAATAAAAQTRVRVTRDRATIWRAGFSVAAAVVPRGTEFDAVARRGTGYEVVLPSAPDMTGFIAVVQVERVSGPEPPDRPPVTPGAMEAPGRAQARARLPPEPAFGVRGFGDFGFESGTHVPNALRGGVAEPFGEHDLGGIEARVKLEIGK